MLLECNRMFGVLTGTLGFNQSTFLMEMSQIGFSTHILNVSILFKWTIFMDCLVNCSCILFSLYSIRKYKTGVTLMVMWCVTFIGSDPYYTF